MAYQKEAFLPSNLVHFWMLCTTYKQAFLIVLDVNSRGIAELYYLVAMTV